MNLDVQFLFKKESLETQKKHGSIIGSHGRRIDLEKGLRELKANYGPNLQSFLDHTHCVNSKIEAQRILAQDLQYQQYDVDKCKSLSEYETSPVVVYQNHIIEKPKTAIQKEKYDPLSSIREGYLDTIIENLENWLPSKMLHSFDVFDNRQWSQDIPIQEQQTGSETKLKQLCEFFGIEYEESIFASWISLLTEIQEDVYPFCYIRSNMPAR